MIYVISDLHLNHKNIIKYCNRPFDNVEDMNNTIINNWNEIVDKHDMVFLIGDLAFGKNKAEWFKKLNGRIILIRGNHDRDLRSKPFLFLHYQNKKFLLIHRPPYEYEGWVIHGHKHNKTPFIDYENKRINVSCELLNYKPVPINDLFGGI